MAVTMRTPGNDFELAVGFLHSEGLLGSRRDVSSVAYCELPREEQQYNVVTVRLTRPFALDRPPRHFQVSSSCGVCGKTSLDQIKSICRPLSAAEGPVVNASTLISLPDLLASSQRVFAKTGGLHASGLFNPDGSLIEAREDIGRHNALDKLVGWALLSDRLPLASGILMVSGRVSFELVQKAATAGVSIVCAVSAPSSLAVEAGQELGLTIVGFVRGERFNVYTHPERVHAP